MLPPWGKEAALSLSLGLRTLWSLGLGSQRMMWDDNEGVRGMQLCYTEVENWREE